MPFSRTDIYTSSGSTPLFNQWTPYVSKFDTSTFYNWEQDNLPLYDLEERTYQLWEQGGFATSAGVPGLALTVSAAASVADFEADRTLFADLSSAIAAVPKVVRFPVLIEVASLGSNADLGALELHNFRIEEGGSIEIINRAFGRALTGGLAASADVAAVINPPASNGTNKLIGSFISLDLSNTLSDSSALNLSAPVLEAAADPRLNSAAWTCMYPQHNSVKSPLSVGINYASILDGQGVQEGNEFKLTPYENTTPAEDSTMNTLDISCINNFTSAEVKREQLALNDVVGGNVYLNALSKLSVKNCDGPVYIRNFFVDGETTKEYGIEIVNSDVILENCSAARAKKAGWKFNNSKVMLSRSAFAYRNYNLLSTTTRGDAVGYGFHAVNSEVTVSSNPAAFGTTGAVEAGASGCDLTVVASRNYAGFVLENSVLTGGIKRADSAESLEQSIIASELNTGPGVVLSNSKVKTVGLVDIFGNDSGIQSKNSEFTFEYLCAQGNQNKAVEQNNSVFTFESTLAPGQAGQSDRHQLDFSGNGQHLSLENHSEFNFSIVDSVPSLYGNSKFINNFGSLVASANIVPLPAIAVNKSKVKLINAQINTLGSDETPANTPIFGRAISAKNQSTVSTYGTKTGCTFIFGAAGNTRQRQVAGVFAQNNSTINVHGPTAIGQYGVDILAEDNSTINIEPPKDSDGFSFEASAFELEDRGNHTSVELHSTRACLVANKNSNINLTDLGSYAVNWNRGTSGTAFLGEGTDYPYLDTSALTNFGCLQFWPAPQDTAAIQDNNLDDLETGLASFTVPNFAQFNNTTDGFNRFFITDNYLNTSYAYAKEPNITLGGVCVRATQDSNVNVKNVHFPVTPNGSPLDGHYYDVSGSECDRFGIWNIADTSRMHAAYTAVSGLHPADAIYHGPSSVWVSAAGSDYAIAYGAPSSTPDTGSLSIFDAFGAGSSVWIPTSGVSVNSPTLKFFPVSGIPNQETVERLADAGISVSSVDNYAFGFLSGVSNNRGPFRLYWTPQFGARLLQSDLSGYQQGAFPHAGNFSGVVGPAYQLFAQGYNSSAPLSALVPDGLTNASSLAPNLLKLSYDSDGDGIPDQLWTSGFYYCNEFVEENPNQCLLDESAAETFANAKNASVGMANRPKKVTLYRSRSSDNRASESYTGDTSGTKGFKSAGVFDLTRDN